MTVEEVNTTGAAGTAPAADGTIIVQNGRQTVRFERTTEHPIEHVWRTLTEPELIAYWLADAQELDLVPGGRLNFVCPGTGDEGAEGTVGVVDPPHTIVYDTEFFGVMRWELTELPTGTRIISTVEKPIPPDSEADMLANWHVHMDFFDDALEGKATDWVNFPMSIWEDIRDQYALRQA